MIDKRGREIDKYTYESVAELLIMQANCNSFLIFAEIKLLT